MPFRTIDDYPELFVQAVMNWMRSGGCAMDNSTVAAHLRQYYGERNWPIGLRREHDRLLREEAKRRNEPFGGR